MSLPLFGDDTVRASAENVRMASQTVECLRCGACRRVSDARGQRLDPGECPRCDYVGWALTLDLSESTRRRMRRLPPQRRARLYAV